MREGENGDDTPRQIGLDEAAKEPIIYVSDGVKGVWGIPDTEHAIPGALPYDQVYPKGTSRPDMASPAGGTITQDQLTRNEKYIYTCGGEGKRVLEEGDTYRRHNPFDRDAGSGGPHVRI